MKRLGLGCVGFVATLVVGMFFLFVALDLTGHLDKEDAQIPIFPILIVIPFALVAGFFASKPTGTRALGSATTNPPRQPEKLEEQSPMAKTKLVQKPGRDKTDRLDLGD